MGYLWIDSRIWPDGVIPVNLESLNVDLDMNTNMQAALLDWMHKTGITFVPYVPQSGQNDYLTFKLDTSRKSSVAGGTGRIGGPQVMILSATGDWSHYSHEVSHTIGFIHEHQRPDRGDYVIVIPPVLGKPLPENYQVYEKTSENAYFGPYDWESVSHYRQNPRLYPNTLHDPPRVGSWGGASEGDVYSVQQAYWPSEAPSVGMLHPNGAAAPETDRLEVVARWTDNRIYRGHWTGSWQTWQPVGQVPSPDSANRDNVGRSLSPPTMVTRGKDMIDVFIRGLYDDVYTSTWAGGSWSPWKSLRGGKALSPVSALSRSVDTIDVAIRGMNCGVYTTHYQAGGWDPWSRVGDGIAASDVSILSPADDQLNLFVLGLNRGIYTSQRRDGESWTAWDRVGTGVAMFGTSVAATSRAPGVIDLFVVGTNRGVYTTASHDSGKTWKEWTRVADGVVAPGTAVTAIKGRGDSLDLFVVGEDQRIWTASWDASGSVGWDDGWSRLGDHTVAHRSAISAVTRTPETIDLFTVGSDGSTWTGAVTNRSLVGWWPAKPSN